MKRSKVGFLATVGLVAVASLFTVCKAVGSSPGVYSTAVGQTIDVGYGEFRALEPADMKRHRTEKRRVRAGGTAPTTPPA